jgi:hypothetical protein
LVFFFIRLPPSPKDKNNKASEEYKKTPEALYQHILEIAFHSYLQKYVEMIGLFALYSIKIGSSPN